MAKVCRRLRANISVCFWWMCDDPVICFRLCFVSVCYVILIFIYAVNMQHKLPKILYSFIFQCATSVACFDEFVEVENIFLLLKFDSYHDIGHSIIIRVASRCQLELIIS